ncbi:MAG: hypothetical protein ACLRIL_01130 [Fusicatenibacter saccharivorans]
MDGANDVTIFAKIVLPLSKASIATIALFTAVGYWKSITSPAFWPISSTKEQMVSAGGSPPCRPTPARRSQSAGVTMAVTATTSSGGSYDQSSIRCRCNRTDSVRISFRAEVLCKRSYDRRR